MPALPRLTDPACLLCCPQRANCFIFMTVTVKNKPGLIVPAKIQRQARLKIGELLEFRVSGSVITILPKLPSADDEYTPAQRRIVDAQLAEGLEDIAKGRVSPRFNTVDEMLASMKSGRATASTTKRPTSGKLASTRVGVFISRSTRTPTSSPESFPTRKSNPALMLRDED
jgi:bifunctional DNA-binding transcriptional regulator/antitoxin component of YhaV-PrlF toxin-antitoxin module